MEITVNNFRGVERAVVTLTRLALVAGRNGAGKSSICQAVGAALSGNGIPFIKAGKDGTLAPMLTKAESGALVRAGFDSGTIKITDGESFIATRWPDPEPTAQGTPPLSSAFAAGLISMIDIDERTRVRVLTDLLGAAPNDEDITIAFKEIGFTTERVAKLMESLKEQGWDVVHKQATEHGAKLKGQWENDDAGGSKYGKDKAARWLPEGWSDELAGMSLETLETELANARQALETAIAASAVNENELAALRHKVAKLPALRVELKDAQDVLRDKQQVHTDALAKRVPVEPEGLSCPHCKKAVKLEDGKLVAGEAKKKKAAAADTAQIEADIVAAKKFMDQAQEAVTTVGNLVRDHEQAERRLKELEAKPTTGGTGDVDGSRQAVEKAEQRLTVYSRKAKADRAHTSIERNQLAIDLLAPNGLRKKKLLRALETFNNAAAGLSKIAAFKDVTIDEEMSIRYGGRLYQLLSASEQFRVRAILQIAIAGFDKSDVVVIDGIDILDVKGRNGLFALLSQVPMKVLCGMTANKPEQVPDLAKAGLGTTYWIEESVARPMEQQAQAA